MSMDSNVAATKSFRSVTGDLILFEEIIRLNSVPGTSPDEPPAHKVTYLPQGSIVEEIQWVSYSEYLGLKPYERSHLVNLNMDADILG